MSSALDILKLNRSSAVAEEAVFAHWQDYRRWLRLRIELLDVSKAETGGTVSFDDSDELDNQARSKMVEDSLKSLSTETRAIFERALEQRLNDARNAADFSQQRLNLDFDTDLERQTLVAMLDECEGRGTDAEGHERDGSVGLVPIDPDAETGWYAVELVALDALPSDATYEIHEKQGWKEYRLQIIAVAVLVIGVVIFNVLPYLPSGEDVVAQVISGNASYNDLPLPASFPADLTLTTQGGETRDLRIEPREAGWFPPDLADDAPADVLYWEDAGISYPARLCVPDAVPLADLASITIHDGVYLPARTYRIAAGSGQPTDLTIAPCNGGESVAAVLDTVEPQAAHGAGETVAISGETAITVLGVDVISRDRDPDLPPETVRVDVRVVVEGANPDWTALRPRLLLSTGTEYAMIGTPRAAGDGTVTVSYGIATPRYARDARWIISTDERHAARWQMLIAPPLPRATVLAQELAVGDPAITMQGTSLRMELPLTNTSDLPLIVQPADLRLSYSGLDANAAPQPLIDGLTSPLTGGEARTITVTIPLSGERGMTLTLGSAIFDLMPVMEGG